mgnify:CR=1 FL=1
MLHRPQPEAWREALYLAREMDELKMAWQECLCHELGVVTKTKDQEGLQF